MRHIRTALKLGALIMMGLAGSRTARAQTPVLTGQALDATGAVHVWSVAGSVTVIGWELDSVHVSGTVGLGMKPFSGGGTRSGYKFTTWEGTPDARHPSHLQIRVPRRAQLMVKTTSADVSMRGVDGSVDVYTIEGRIEFAGAPSELTAESMRGAITVSGAPGWVRAKSGTGQVRFSGRARDLSISTVSGRIQSTSRFERGRFESVRGDVEIAGPLDRTAIADVDSHEGNVTLRLAPSSSASFTVFTVSGSITNQLSDARSGPSAGTGSELAFATGGSRTGARVTVRTFAGSVALLRP